MSSGPSVNSTFDEGYWIVNETKVTAVGTEDSPNSGGNIETVRNGSFPIELDRFRSISHILLVSTGVPLNLAIAVVILMFRRLHKKPRNVLWLGVTFCSVLTLLTILVEFLAHRTENDSICLVFVSTTGVAYTWLLFVLLLALLDRYAAIVHPLWHREKVTVRRVIIGQIGGCSFFILLIKFPFIAQLVPLRCAIFPEQNKIIAITNAILFVSCITAQIVVYIKTRQCFNNSQQNGELSVSFVNIPRQRSEAIIVESTSRSGPPRHQPAEAAAATGSSQIFRHQGGNSRRMEMEATCSLLEGVCSLLVFTFPTLLIGFINWGCRMVYGKDQCSLVDTVTLYSRELLLGHLVYNPISYAARSREFSLTIREKFRM